MAGQHECSKTMEVMKKYGPGSTEAGRAGANHEADCRSFQDFLSLMREHRGSLGDQIPNLADEFVADTEPLLQIFVASEKLDAGKEIFQRLGSLSAQLKKVNNDNQKKSLMSVK